MCRYQSDKTVIFNDTFFLKKFKKGAKLVHFILIDTFVILKKFIYILIFISGFQFSSFAQAKPIPLSLNSEVEKTVKFYPNPAVSFINFEFSKEYDNSYSIVIFNFIGKKIEDLQVTSEKMSVSLTDFYRGVYIFQLRDKQGNIVESGKFQVVK